MRKVLFITAVLAVVIGLLTSAVPTAAQDAEVQDADPESVIRAFHAAITAGDLDTALNYYAEGIVLVVLPPAPGHDAVIVGKEANRADWEQTLASNLSYEITELEVVGDKVAWTATVHDDVLRELGVSPATFDIVSIVQDGLIIAETWAMTKESLDRVMAAVSFQDAVAAGNEAFMTAFAAGNAPGISALYTEEAQALPPNGDIAAGREAIQTMWQGFLDLGLTGVTIETVELASSGDIGYEVGQFTILAGDQVVDEGKYIVIWKLEEGQWKLHRDIWNSSRPVEN